MMSRGKDSTRHYELSEWADFVHELAPPSQSSRMEQHLEDCRLCRHQVEFITKVARAAVADAGVQLPEHVFRLAKSIFALHEPEKGSSWSRIIARLVYDSFREPLPAGIRGTHRISRQAMYEAGDYCLDLKMEHEQGSAKVLLVGQIANAKQPERGIENVPVLLMSGKSTLARAVSNEFGEFQMEFASGKRLKLLVPVLEQQKEIEVQLNGMAGR